MIEKYDIEKEKDYKIMPQLDTAALFTQVFWVIFLFLGFYLMALKHVIPNISESLKTRKKKIESSSEGLTNFQEEEAMVTKHYDEILAKSLNESRELLTKTVQSSSDWLDATTRKTNESMLLDMNKEYIKTIGEISGQKYLIKNCIQK